MTSVLIEHRNLLLACTRLFLKEEGEIAKEIHFILHKLKTQNLDLSVGTKKYVIGLILNKHCEVEIPFLCHILCLVIHKSVSLACMA